MKKIITFFFTVIVLFSVLCFGSCARNDKMEKLVSQLRYDVLYSSSENYEIYAYKELTELPLKSDGKIGELKNVLTFKIVFRKEISLKSSPIIQFRLDGINYRKEFEYRPLSNYVSCCLILPSMPENKLDVTIDFDSEKQTHTLLTTKNKKTLSEKDILSFLKNTEDADARKILDGEKEYEIRIRLIYSDGFNCYFLGLYNEDFSVNFLLDGETGELLAKKI